ncbi:VOC family protein [Paraburkholderia sp. BL10I2N1]|uniref:VOC family protein n=1 Tax=Paraburkholderia sp. BL10I2N1 TaxID=1938796 RepID=UPI001FB59C53|nr:VOC family protein [Paraburkholderia sp. BL10I2N1]
MSHILALTDNAVVEPSNGMSVVKPYVMSHGTLPCRDLAKSRKFYEEFLGMECVQHGITSMVIRCGLKFHIVCVNLGDACPPCNMHNHWGIDVTSEAEVDAAHEAAIRLKDAYGIQEVQQPERRHGVYSFYMVDLNGSWWEIQYYPGFQNDDMFDFGDRFTPDGKAITDR